MAKVNAVAIAMLAGALVGYVGGRLILGLDQWVANAIGIGTSAVVGFAMSRNR
uniref:hypothetical protein n=1 Tax=Acidovorax sp. SUPP3334 TaxID=2920881 RepID=UPI00295294F2|nr:hypothetical protein [Acidovorax sp. SUPP3334]BDH38338.1 hypothetical protein AVHM3334_23065 [Acidovorax sp. SUPP3334]